MNRILRHALLPDAALVALTIVVYIPSLSSRFIWDDNEHFVRNPHMTSLEGLRDIWTTPDAVYYPLVLTTWWVLRWCFGLLPLPYHLINIVLHALSACVLRRFLMQIRVRCSWLAAACFALHPINVQSVAWATELKNTQSGFFFLGAALAFVHSRSGSERRVSLAYLVSLICFALGLLSKPSGVMLPVVLLAIGLWSRRGIDWRGVRATVPFFMLSIMASLWTIWEQQARSGAVGVEWSQSAAQRLILASLNGWFYLGKVLWPHPMMFFYPRWSLEMAPIVIYLPIAAWIVLALVLLKVRSDWAQHVILGLICYLALLLPVMGFFRIYYTRYSYVADHFAYLPSIALCAMVPGALAVVMGPCRVRLQYAVGAMLLLGLGVLTMSHASAFSDCNRLQQDTIRKNPRAWMVHTNFGVALSEEARHVLAAAQFRRALAIYPDDVRARHNLALDRERCGDQEGAIEMYLQILKIRPDYVQSRVNLGMLLLARHEIDQSVVHLSQAVRDNPNAIVARYDLSLALAQRGDVQQALAQLRQIIAINPDHVAAHMRLGLLLAEKNRFQEAVEQLSAVVRLNPKSRVAHHNLGTALMQLGRFDDAIATLRRAFELDSNATGTLTTLAWVLATHPNSRARHPEQAIRLAEKAVLLTDGKKPLPLDALGAAHAAAGRYDRALTAAQRAEALARHTQQSDLADRIAQRIEQYRLGKTPSK